MRRGSPGWNGSVRRWLLLSIAVLATMAAGCQGEDPTGPQSRDAAGGPTPSPQTEVGAASPTPKQNGDSAHRVWVALEDEDQVVLVDLKSEKVVSRRDFIGGPHNLTVAGNGAVAVALPQAGRIGLVRTGSTRTVELGGSPHDVKPTAGSFAVANEGDNRIDLVTSGGRRTGSIDLKHPPHDLTVSPDGGRAWVTLNGTDLLAIVELENGGAVRYVPTGARPHDLLLGPDGRLWVTDWDGSLHVMSKRGRVIRTLPIGDEAHHLTFTPDGTEAWVVDHATHNIVVIDTRDLEPLEQLHVAGAPHHVAITADGELAAVADHDNGTLVIFDVKRHREVGVIPVGAGPHGVWAVPDL